MHDFAILACTWGNQSYEWADTCPYITSRANNGISGIYISKCQLPDIDPVISRDSGARHYLPPQCGLTVNYLKIKSRILPSVQTVSQSL